MTWGGANRPITSNKLGIPNRHQGDDGDIQIRQTELGAKIFGKVGGEWYDAPLSIKGVTKYGTNLSSYLSIDSDSMDVYKEDIKVASFSENTTITGGSITLRSSANNDDKFIITADSAKFYDNNNEVASFGANTIIEGGTVTIRNTTNNNDKVVLAEDSLTIYDNNNAVATFAANTVIEGGTVTIRNVTNNNDKVVLAQDSLKVYDNNTEVASFGADTIIGEVGASKSNVQITSGAINLRTNTTTKLSLDSSGDITTKGVVKIQSAASDGDLGLLLENDGDGYNQLFFKGANPEIFMGYSGSGNSFSGDSTGSTGDIKGSSKLRMNRELDEYLSTVVFATAETENYALGGTESEFRVCTGGDIRDETKGGIRIDSSGNIGFRGSAPAAAPNYTGTTQSVRNADTATNTSALQDVVQTLVADLISMGILQ